jgi:hypothetical protein
MSSSSLADIQREQARIMAERNMMQQRKKSLISIQLEERAVLEIQTFYEQTSAPYSGEYVVVYTKPRNG